MLSDEGVILSEVPLIVTVTADEGVILSDVSS